MPQCSTTYTHCLIKSHQVLVAHYRKIDIKCCPKGTDLEGFLRFPETTQDFLSTMGAPFFSYKVSRDIHSGLNSGVTGFCFDSRLRKCSEDLSYFLFFWFPQRKLETFAKFCVAASPETLIQTTFIILWRVKCLIGQQGWL